ncbi:hypothetical protein DNHGIG_08200 [Collibacillus ludicampi]|uniref:histidine kinase n=1 Tax=Collibacillus ludicampi TaxID=2771369 RepID=A0AAV4LC02_9BACL|nr:hypothetical protein DNHGIG_08200 [Collibacillus ludicampi]
MSLRSKSQSENQSVQDTDHTLSRLASIGQMAAGIAHEVRNPLTAVKGFLQLMQKESPHAFLETASSELERAISTLQNLLEVAKPDLDDEPFVAVNLCSELEAILYLFQDQIYRVHIEKHFLNTDQMIYGKRNQLKKAFFNLLKNAFEAIPDRGTISIQHYRMGDSVYVTIQDTGIGIPEEKLSLLGTPFFSMKENGTGMGLAQVFSTIYQHGATIDVKSKEGKGTTFTIIFPVTLRLEDGVIDMQLQYISGQSLRDFILQNEDRIHETLSTQVKDLLQQVDSRFSKNVFETFQKMIHFLVEGRQHELVVLAKERGQIGAKTDIPLVVLLELIQTKRKVYWEILHQYFKQVDLDKENFFQLERKTNSLFDTYIMHYFSSYIEYKDELLRAQREIIDDLTVPIIPISSTMAVLPILGTVDTYRAKRIQERALTQISTLKTERIIIDLSGVAIMDTAVVGHLFRIVEGISLMGCKAVVTGIRPEIANTMINMGISLTGKIETKGTLQQAIEEFGLK